MKRRVAPAQPPSQRVWDLLVGVWLVAFTLRCLYVWQISGAPFFDLRIGDAESYHLWARRIADGDWLGSGVFYQAPLYPYLLGIVYRILGDSVTTVRVVQALIGATSCAFLAAGGIALFGRAGAIAGLGLAIYPSAIFLDGLLEKSALVTFFTAALLALLASKPERATARHWLGTGVVLGLLALTRENALLLVVPVLLWIGFGPSRRTPDLKVGPTGAVLAFVVGCTVTLLPVALRNFAVGGEFHLTTSQFGPNFYIGNHAGAKGTYEALVMGHGSAADEREDATRLAQQATGRKLSPEEVSSYWAERSFDYIRSQPIEWLKLMARKLALTFNAAEVADTESQDVYAQWSWLLRLLRPFNFGVLLGLAALGTVLTAHDWRRLWFLYGLVGTYTLSVVIFYVFARYRFPIVPVLLLLAAGGVRELLAYRRSARGGRAPVNRPGPKRLAVAAGVAVIAVAFSHLPLEDERNSRATHYYDIATVLSKDPSRVEQALTFYRRALDEEPRFAPAQYGLGNALVLMGRPQEAISYYQASLETWPDNAEGRYNLGLALAATGQEDEASRQFSEALSTRPDDPDIHVALAKALLVLKLPERAVDHYHKALALQPAYVTALVGLGVALAELGRPDEAIAQYRRALQLDPENAEAYNNLGGTLANQGRIAEALPHFERAVALKPNDENARRNLERARQLGYGK